MSEMTETSPVDETDPIYVQRRMLRFRSWHRGTKEADLLLGSFCDRYVNTFTPEQLCRYEALLADVPDPEAAANLVVAIRQVDGPAAARARGRAWMDAHGEHAMVLLSMSIVAADAARG